MVQPGSAAVTSAGCSARCGAPDPAWLCAAAVTGRGAPGRYGAANSTGTAALAAAAVTARGLPGRYGAANSTGSSAVTVPPGGIPATCDGAGVLTPAPSTRTVSGPAGSDASLTTSPRMIWRGRATVPANRSVEVTEVMRISSSSHANHRSNRPDLRPIRPGSRAGQASERPAEALERNVSITLFETTL